ncbi:MAG: hypothetical protein JWM27_2366 [Gemmatimonadetes bacterium]|nr:hypothetical protein [Gemmatimonadota bacterium]
MRSAAFAVFAAALAACGAPRTPIPVASASASASAAGDVSSLAGDWQGEYHGRDSRRSGSIVFHLAADADTAWGEVVMLASTGTAAVARPSGAGAAGVAPTRTQPLAVRFVRLDGGRVSGVLASYRDPACGCPVRTTFDGHLHDGTVDGEFTTRVLGTGAEQVGTWRVRKTGGPPATAPAS